MLTREEIIVEVATILGALKDAEDRGASGCPESLIYIAMGSNMGKYNVVSSAMVRGDLISVRGNFVRLTDKGRDLALEVNQAIEDRQKEKREQREEQQPE